METIAKAKMIRIAPRKTRLVINLIRGKNVNDALAILENQNTIIELNNDDEKTHSQKLMPMIDEAFKKSNISKRYDNKARSRKERNSTKVYRINN